MSHGISPSLPKLGADAGQIYSSLSAQLKDAVSQAHHTDVVFGLSGGIDSALTAALAADALGAGRVHGIIMPSPFTGKTSVDDALEIAHNLGIETFTIAIDSILAEYELMLEAPMYGMDTALTHQNLQARIRANILMAFSNQFNWLVLSTRNRSESMVGYTTLYGDMVGAFAPLAPLYKGWVYELVEFRNAHEPVIPEDILTKAPSAELASGQTDEAELGPYAQLDAILYQIDQGKDVEDIIKQGFDRDALKRIEDMINRAQFKHRYAAPPAVLPDLDSGIL